MGKKYRNKKVRSGEDFDTRGGKSGASADLRPYVKGAKHSNDISWYNLNPQLLKDAASLNFSNVVGTHLPDLVENKNSLDGAKDTPGVMRFGFEIGYGVSENPSDPINSAAQNIYSYVRHANSGSRNYEAVDLMQYLLAMDSIYTWFTHLTRIYGVACLYNARNKYYPKAILTALGAYPNDIINHLADFRGALNARIPRILSRAIPTVMPLFKRHAWLGSQVFLDSTLEDKAGVYVFAPDKLWKYVDKGNPVDGYAGFLDPVITGFKSINDPGTGDVTTTTYNLRTYEELIAILDDMLDAVMMSEDAGIMSGDIMKVWGSNLWKVDFIPDMYTVHPVYDDVVLHQIQNMTLNGACCDNYKIRQNVDTGALIYQPSFYFETPNVFKQKLLNIRQSSPTPDAIMESTRNMTFSTATMVVDDIGGTAYKNTVDVCGSDCFTLGTIITLTEDDEIRAVDFTSTLDLNRYNLGTLVHRLTKFDWAPYLYMVDTFDLETNAFPTFHGVLGDTDNYTTVDEHTLNKMHITAMQSLVGLPVLSAFNLK